MKTVNAANFRPRTFDQRLQAASSAADTGSIKTPARAQASGCQGDLYVNKVAGHFP